MPGSPPSSISILPRCSIQYARGQKKGLILSLSSDNHYDDDSFYYNDDVGEEVFVDLKDEEEEEEEKEEDRESETIAYLQKTNNMCTTYIKIGKYNKAIVKLGESLQILDSEIIKNNDHDEEGEGEDEEALTFLDGCIDYSERRNNHRMEGSLIATSSSSSSFHATPIRIPIDRSGGSVNRRRERLQRTGSPSSNLLFCIITFNLSLAHHLKALTPSTSRITSSSSKSTTANPKSATFLMKSAIRLYKLLLGVMSDGKDRTADDRDDRFTTIVQKNLEHAKHKLLMNKEHKTRTKKTRRINTGSSCDNTKEKGNSLLEQHKELLRNRYASSTSSSLKFVKEEDGFTTKLQNAMRTSSSFVHLQQKSKQKNVVGAYAA